MPDMDLVAGSEGFWKLLNKIYDDMFHGTSQIVGEALGDGARHLYDKLKIRLAEIPDERKQPPPFSLANEIVKQGVIFFETPILQEMFANLLGSACDSNLDGSAHPSFVDRIRQMNPSDATLLNHLARQRPMVLSGADVLRKAYTDHPGSWKTGLRPFFRYLNLDADARREISLDQMPTSLENLIWLGLAEFESHSETAKMFRQYGTGKLVLAVAEVSYFSQIVEDPHFFNLMEDEGLMGEQIKFEGFLVRPTNTAREFMRSCVFATDEEREEYVDAADPRHEVDTVFQYLEVDEDGKTPNAIIYTDDVPDKE